MSETPIAAAYELLRREICIGIIGIFGLSIFMEFSGPFCGDVQRKNLGLEVMADGCDFELFIGLVRPIGYLQILVAQVVAGISGEITTSRDSQLQGLKTRRISRSES